MDATVPDYLIREQAAVGALVAFGVMRVIVAAVACARGWRILAVEQAFIGVAALWCAPQLFEWLWDPSSASVLAEFEGNAIGCAIALFCAPILSHRLGFE
jgi:hypothetical protein